MSCRNALIKNDSTKHVQRFEVPVLNLKCVLKCDECTAIKLRYFVTFPFKESALFEEEKGPAVSEKHNSALSANRKATPFYSFNPCCRTDTQFAILLPPFIRDLRIEDKCIFQSSFRIASKEN